VARINKKKNPFTLPGRLNPTNLDDEYDHKRFKRWISDLPVGSVSNTARALHTELNRMNHLEMSPVERFEALELMLPSTGFVLERLRAHFVSTPIPLSKKNRLVARLHLELLVRVIVGYKTILAQFHDDSFTGYLLHKRTRVESCRRLLYFLGDLLQHEYAIYKASPRFVWKEIHGVYYYAVQNELISREVYGPEDATCGPLGIVGLYKQILLLALANPNSLLKGEVKKVNDILPRWVSEVVLNPIAKVVLSQPLFVVDAQKDSPPCYAEERDLKQINKGWSLDTTALDKLLEQEISSIKGNSKAQLRPIDAVSVKLFSKLQVAWGQGITSREERRKRAGIIDVTCGLGSLYQLLGGERLPASAVDKVGSPFSSPQADESGQAIATVDHDEFIIDAGADLSTGFAAETEPVQEQEIELDIINSVPVDEIDSRECISVNESARGCYLTWPGEDEYKVRVGDLIGVNPRENLDLSEAWDLGIIRWVSIQGHGLMGFGVELLDGEIEPVRLERWHESGPKVDTMLGFQQKDEDSIYSLITQPFYIGEQDKFLLVTDSAQLPVVLGPILECTDAIMRCNIEHDANAVGQVDASQSKYSASDDPFSTLWDDLDI